MSEIRLYMLQTGMLGLKVHNMKMNQGEGAALDVPVPFFLITHPEGHTLIDGGVAVEAAIDPAGYWGGVCEVFKPRMKESEGCVNQIEALGIDPDEIRYVVMTHLHLDHTGAVGRFKNATYIVQRKEYEYALAPDWYAQGAYIRQDFDRPDLNWCFLHGMNDDYYDLYDDGVVKTIYTPGHSPGHMSVLVTLPESGAVLLASDAVYTKEHWEEKALPGFSSSLVESCRSVKKLRAVAEKTKAMVVTEHDAESWKYFKKAPEYYS